MVTWKSASTSSRNASNASSVRSSSSISSTGAPAGVGLERLQQRPLDQEALGEHVVLEPLAVVLAFGLGDADRDHLRGVVPLVDRGGDVEALVALQPDQPAAERRGQHLGDLGLADAGLAFEEQRPAHLAARETARSPASGRRGSRPSPSSSSVASIEAGSESGSVSGSWRELILVIDRTCPGHPRCLRMARQDVRCPARGRA